MMTQKESASQPSHQVPEKKQTSLGLYLTAQEAYDMWKADPKRVNILDVRTPEEYIFVGHPDMARNIPLLFVKHQLRSDKNEPAVEPNPDFVSTVKGLLAPTDTLLVMCRCSGSQPACKSRVCEHLQHHRWHGRGQCGRPRKCLSQKTDEKWLEELWTTLDL